MPTVGVHVEVYYETYDITIDEMYRAMQELGVDEDGLPSKERALEQAMLWRFQSAIDGSGISYGDMHVTPSKDLCSVEMKGGSR